MTDPTPVLSAERLASLVTDTSPYLSCDDCFTRLDAYVEARIADPSHGDAAMDAHLAGCGACADEADALQELVRQELP